MNWTEEREEKLRKLWDKGHTASQISEMLGQTTRNAVIGKAHRLNLATRVASKTSALKSNNQKEIQNGESAKKVRITSRSKFKSLLLDKNFEAESPKKLEELDDNTCKWGIGHPDEKDFYFCGRSSVKGFSYCKLHVLYAFQPKHMKDEQVSVEDEIPKFIEKKIKSA